MAEGSLVEPPKAFDAYEVIGVITPGTVVALLLLIEWPQLKGLVGASGLSVGDFGLFVLIAFVLGHLVQAIGNMLEGLVWLLFGGMPTAWARRKHQTLITPSQRQELEAKVSQMEHGSVDLASVSAADWRSIVRRIDARVRAAGRATRVDTFNRTYGLSRGLAAAFLMTALWLSTHFPETRTVLAAAALFVIAAGWRMYRSGVSYARCLFLEFIDLPSENPAVAGSRARR